MRTQKFSTLAELRTAAHPELQKMFDPIFAEIQKIFPDSQPVLQRNCQVFKFPNGTRIYLNSYRKKILEIGFGQGRELLASNPALAAIFDETKTVVAKLKLSPANFPQKLEIFSAILGLLPSITPGNFPASQKN